jgi:hypothetical protein
MVAQDRFVAVMVALFPTLSNTAVGKCWDGVRRLPEPALDALYNGLLHGGIAAMAARQAEAAAITNAIGIPERVR